VPFDCDRCGSCCAMIKCKHLGPDNLCMIYETRPDICKVELNNRTGMKQEDYYALVKDLCAIWRKWRDKI